MPTARPRYQITETEDVRAALDLAAQRWPDEGRSNLMRRLILTGAQALAQSQIERTLEIETALQSLAGLADGYPPGYLDRLRADWDRVTA